MKTYNKIYIVIITLLILVILCGCGVDINRYSFKGLANIVSERAEANVTALQNFSDAGLLDKATATKMIENVNKQAADLINGLTTESEELIKSDGKTKVNIETLKTFLAAVVGWHYVNCILDGDTLYIAKASNTQEITDLHPPEATYNLGPQKYPTTTGIWVYKAHYSKNSKGEDVLDGYYWENTGGEEDAKDVLKQHFITNALADAASTEKPNKDYKRIRDNIGIISIIEERTPVPLELMSFDSSASESKFLERLSFTVYALKPGIMLDQVMKDIKDDRYSSYFSEIKDADGNSVKLIDMTKPENKLIVRTSNHFDPDANAGSQWNPNLETGVYIFNDAKYRGNGDYAGILENVSRDLGNDMIVYQGWAGRQEAVLALQLVEFSQKAIDNIMSKVSITQGAYKVVGSGKDGRAYLMEYPVSYIEGIEIVKDGDTYYWNPQVRLSNIRLNIDNRLLSKQLGVRRYENGKVADSGEIIQVNNDDSYILATMDKPNTSSFYIYGETGITEKRGGTYQDGNDYTAWNLVFGEAEKSIPVSIPRILLTDYLEATYTPDIVKGEQLVCYGRKIRFDYTKLGKDESDKDKRILGDSLNGDSVKIAYYCAHGEETDGTTDETRWVYLDQLCDIYSVSGIKQPDDSNKIPDDKAIKITDYSSIPTYTSDINPYIRYLPKIKAEIGSTGNEFTPADVLDGLDNNTYNGSATEYQDDTNKMICVIVKDIKTTFEFPGQYIDKSDFENGELYNKDNNKQLMYAMVIWTDQSESGLIEWIMKQEETPQGLLWWKDWLKTHGYNYYNLIGDDALEEFLYDNYRYKIAGDGFVILNMETILKINQELIHTQKVESTRNIRTAFVVLGVILIMYAALLLAAWAFDINIDVGVNVLEKITFKNMVAVSSHEEIPDDGERKVRYVNFKEILICSIIYTAVGIILISIDIVYIIRFLLERAAGIAQFIENGIKGIRG